jgi:hypothetical protein
LESNGKLRVSEIKDMLNPCLSEDLDDTQKNKKISYLLSTMKKKYYWE